MARRKHSSGGGIGGPSWLITFTDLMTLIFTFFVLLVSMATIDERAKLTALGSVSRSFGVSEHMFNPKATGKKPLNNMREPGAMEGPEEDLAPIRDMLYEDVEKDLEFMENKYVQILSINDQVLFTPGSTTLSPRGMELLDRLLPYLQQIEYPVLVAGHTAVRRDEESSYSVQTGVVDSTWLLSYQRALSVYRHFLASGVSAGKLSLEAFGQYHPRYSNNIPTGRQKNRRVDLVLDKRNLAWIRKVESLREAEPAKVNHFYKGFKFDLAMPGESVPKGGADGAP